MADIKLRRYNGTGWDDINLETTWSQIQSKPSTFTPTSHTHGYVTDDGRITSAATIATGDHLVIADNSQSNKVITSSITFDTSNTTEFLRKDGTFGTPAGTTFNGGTITSSLVTSGSGVDIDLARESFITFYGGGSVYHSIGSRSATGSATDDLRINSFGAVYINLDSNDNNASNADFQIGRHGDTTTISDWLLTLKGETGRLGIGTTSPTQALDVDGSIKIQNNAQLYMYNTDNYIKYNYWRVNTGSNVNIFNEGNSDIVLSTNNAERMRLKASGNVGISESAPHERLTVGTSNGRADLAIYRSGNNISSNTSVGRLTFDVDYNSSPMVVGEIIGRTTEDSAFRGSLDFNVKSTSGVSLTGMTLYGTLSDDPKVGILTTTPTEALDVNGNAIISGDNRYLTMGTPGAGTTTGARFFSIEGNTDTSGEGSGRIFFTEHNSSTAQMDNYGMSLGYRGGATSIEGASGNTWTGLSQIGNGQWGMWGHNNSAAGALVMSGDRAATYIDFHNNELRDAGKVIISNANPILQLNDTSTDANAYIDYQAGTSLKVHAGSDPIVFIAGNSEKARLTAGNGYLGVGSTNPSYGLDVHANDGQIRAYGTIAKIWAEASDDGQASFELKNTEGHFRFITDNGAYTIYDQTDAVERFKIDTNGNQYTYGNLRVQSTFPRIYLTDTDSNSDYSIINNNGTFGIYDDTNSAYRMQINSSGTMSTLKSSYGEPSSEDFYRIKFQDQGGTHNDIGIGQSSSGNLGYNVTAGESHIFYEGTNGEIARLQPSGLALNHSGTGTVDSKAITFTSQFNSTDVSRDLKTNSAGDLLFNGNELATESFVESAAGYWKQIYSGTTTITSGTSLTTITTSETLLNQGGQDQTVIAFELNTSSISAYTSQIHIVKLENSSSSAGGILFNALAGNTSVQVGSIRVFRGIGSTDLNFQYSYKFTNGSTSEIADTVYVGRVWKIVGVNGV